MMQNKDVALLLLIMELSEITTILNLLLNANFSALNFNAIMALHSKLVQTINVVHQILIVQVLMNVKVTIMFVVHVHVSFHF